MGNTFGQLFRITTWGESHGGGVGVVVDGCPPGLALTELDVQPDLDRRRPGQSTIVTPRKETDIVEILSGTFEGRTLGTPISMWVRNRDARPDAYSEIARKYRPSHADFTYQAKFGIRNWQGGGRTSVFLRLIRNIGPIGTSRHTHITGQVTTQAATGSDYGGLGDVRIWRRVARLYGFKPPGRCSCEGAFVAARRG